MDWSEEISVKPIKIKTRNADENISAVQDLLSQVLDNKRIDKKYKPEIRMSRLPLCGLLHTLEVLENKIKHVHFSMDFLFVNRKLCS